MRISYELMGNSFLEKGNDYMARWLWLILAGQGTIEIIFISAYCVYDGAREIPVTARTVLAQQEQFWHSKNGCMLIRDCQKSS